MFHLVLKAYCNLIFFDLYLAHGNFAALYNRVRHCPVNTKTLSPDGIEAICWPDMSVVDGGYALRARRRSHL